MKLSVDIPDAVRRKAKAAAAKRGQSLRQFVVEALQEKVQAASRQEKEPEWMKFFGAFGKTAAQRAENRRIEKVIEEAFETVDPDEDFLRD